MGEKIHRFAINIEFIQIILKQKTEMGAQYAFHAFSGQIRMDILPGQAGRDT